MASQIQIIPSANINRSKWDECIRAASNAVIYAYSFYLDALTDDWSGVIMNDYDAVMPVPWRKKLGVRYTYDVPFIQQLGCFTKKNSLAEGLVLAGFYRFIKYGSYSFNYGNKSGIDGTIMMNNYIINLNSPYRFIPGNYKKDAINNLKKALRFPLAYQACNYEVAIEMYTAEYKSRFKNTREKDYLNFAKLCKLLQQKDMLFARMVVDETNGSVLCAAIFFEDGRRIYNIMNATTDRGRKNSANHSLLDNVLKEFAGSGMVFDFEGSDIPGIKSFYENFGAVNQPYQRLEKFNHLPFPLNI